MNTSRKVFIILLGLVTLGLAAVSAYIAFQVEDNTSSEDSAASGFGDEATTDLFQPVHEEFQSTPCEYFFNQNIFDAAKEYGTVPEYLKAQPIKVYNRENFEKLPKNCEYYIGNNIRIDFYLYSYAEDSFIDDSQQALFDRINGESITALVSQTSWSDSMKYYYGLDIGSSIACRVNIFHAQNDFEYASLVITGRGIDCAEDTALIEQLSGIFVEKVQNIFSQFEREY